MRNKQIIKVVYNITIIKNKMILYSMKYLILLIFFLTISLYYGQTTVIIGENNGANTSYEYPCPLQDYFGSQRGQYLYDASSLFLSGLPSGAIITNLGWIVNPTTIEPGTEDTHQMNGIFISLKNTSITSLPNNAWETGLTQVFGPGNYSYFSGSDVIVTAATTNFIYNGGGLLVELCSGSASSNYSSNPSVQWTTYVGYNASHQYVEDYVDGCGNMTVENAAISTNRPRLQITYIIPSNPPNPPISISASTSTICPNQSSILSVNGSQGTTYWFVGSCVSTISSSVGSGTSIIVSPTATTTYFARNYSNGLWSSGCVSTTITVVSALTPSTPTSNSPQCNSVTITRSGTPPTGTTWYWQGTSVNGTTTTLGSGPTYTTTSSGTYYLRAMNSVGCWSSISSFITLSVAGYPLSPSNPTITNNQCTSATLTRTGSPPSGVIWYWQGTNSTGTVTTLGSGATFNATSSGTYYIRAVNSAGCWSTNLGDITVNLTSPSIPLTPTSNSPQCASVTINQIGNVPNGEIWYWQGTNSAGTITTLGSGATFNATSSGTYYIRAINSAGCWSNASASILVNVVGYPSIPSTLNSNSPQCGDVTINSNGNQPTGVIWYWQGSNSNGNSTIISDASYIANTSGTYYLRAYTAPNCWSVNSSSINVIILIPTLSNISVNACDSYTASDGVQYINSGLYQSIIPNTASCDSTINIQLSIHPSYSIIDTIFACQSYLWSNGDTYFSNNNTATQLFTTNAGCDSIVSLNLFIGQPNIDTTYIQSTVLGYYEYNGITYNQSGTYFQTLVNEFGCDSLVQLHLIIEPTWLNEQVDIEIFVSPNPSEDGQFVFSIPLVDMELDFFDAYGKAVSFSSNQNIISIQTLAKGTYFAVLSGRNLHKVFKLIYY